MVRQTSGMSPEERSALIKSIGKLPLKQASLICLYYLQNHTSEEVADILQLSPEEFSIEHYAALTALHRWMHKLDGL